MTYINWFNLIKWTDSTLYLYFLLSVLYLFFFSVFSYRKRKYLYVKTKKQYRYAVFFPTNGEDDVIVNSVKSFLNQSYPRDKFDVVVISENMRKATSDALRKLPIILLEAKTKNGYKARQLEYAAHTLDAKDYDVAVIFEANNTVDSNFLEEINKAYHLGGMAIQTHRIAKNLRTNTSILDAISEEINNTIFRKGHVCTGFSCSLIGSGMALHYEWFRQNIAKVTEKHIAKQIEGFLLKQGIYIEYLDDVYTYADKVHSASHFFKQRREWLSGQSYSLRNTIKDLPKALFAANFDYCDKILQWMMLPRILLLTFTIIIATLHILFYKWTMSLKWWGMLLFLMMTFSLAIPDKFINGRTLRALLSLPGLAFLMFLGLFGFRFKRKA